ncbi:DNA translocase FtsK [Sporolactobacillus pectinivorans]|uniref:DNA translocase FtsK n=1 Tax=Sporolactobacillus pectinivorans TaxID=1591408 RepID=UPI000C25F405|nr:DNA translocase FtsK [Sporolactobacillus pectinivorans]
MWDWWRRLFDAEEDEDEDPEGIKAIFHTHGEIDQGSPSVGRFTDAHRQIEVKMFSQYPEGNVKNTNISSSGNGKKSDSEPRDEEGHENVFHDDHDEMVLKKASIKKPPFRLSKVPSPVFGFRKPPENFYRTNHPENYYLDAQKEGQEKKQISEVKNGELTKNRSIIPSRKDGPVIEQKVIDEPSLQRLGGTSGTERSSGDRNQYSGIADTERSELHQTIQGHISLPDTDESHRNQYGSHSGKEVLPERRSVSEADRQTVHPVPVRSRLNRSPHRSGTQSKVPINVLMFQSDHQRSHSLEHSVNRLNRSSAGRPYGSTPSEGLQLPLSLLDDLPETSEDNSSWIAEKEKVLGETLANFHVEADLIGYVQGPSVTRFDIHLHPGVKINKVLGLTEDIKLSLAVRQIRIAPVPGKSAVGIEIPNELCKPVLLKQILSSKTFLESKAPLTAALGQDVSGNQIVTDLAKMPHGLIAGATGSGKSVCIHSLILSLIYKTSPDDVRFLLIDPKVVELAPYQNIPHLAAPVITEPKEAALALKWAVEEMEKRYHKFAASRVRDIESFNKNQDASGSGQHLPYIVIIIDELADLMMVSPQDVEEAVCRIAQKARAAGIHLLLATQRPSVDVITGLIKSNIPTRIAFSVSSQTDSRTILDCGGAERLLGRGDMLFAENGARGLKRIQGCFVSDEEINRVTGAFGDRTNDHYLFSAEDSKNLSTETGEMEDDLLEAASAFVIEQGQASVSSIQRHFRIGYNRAARLVEDLENRNVISGANGSKPRQVLVTRDNVGE